MTPEEFALKMKEIETVYEDDPEVSHSKMDDLMCEVLESLGYIDGVAIFEESGRWYA